MADIRKTIMNTFADEETCDMFIMVLEKKWRDFKSPLIGKATMEVVKDVTNPQSMSVIWTYENPEDLTTINEFGNDWIIPYRDRLKPKTETFTGVVEIRMIF